MPQFILPVIPKLTVTAVVDILAVALLIYQGILIVRGRRAAHILTGLWILGIVYIVAVYAHLELLRWVLAALAPYTAVASPAGPPPTTRRSITSGSPARRFRL